MKLKLFLTLLLISSYLCISAQEFQGKAIYKTSRKSSFKIEDGKGVSDKMQEELRKRIQKMNQKTFILTFDKNASVYKEEVKLNTPKPQIGKTKVISFGGSGSSDIYYKNLKENRFSNKTAIMGKPFLVKDSLKDFDWELSSETKNIGTYTCYKATFSKEVENIETTMVNGELEEVKTKEVITTTVWYTPQVPVSNGPKNYQGLPGLILEMNDGKTTIVCTEIVLNPSEKIRIVEPKKGKVVSQKKYDQIQKQKSKEMMEKFKSRKGFDLGNGVNIKIGG